MTDAPKNDQLTLPRLRALSARSAQFLSVRVAGSQLPKRVRDGAAAHGVETVGDLTAYSAEALLTWPGIGGVVLHRAGIALCEMAGLPTSIMRRTRWDELRGILAPADSSSASSKGAVGSTHGVSSKAARPLCAHCVEQAATECARLRRRDGSWRLVRICRTCATTRRTQGRLPPVAVAKQGCMPADVQTQLPSLDEYELYSG